MPLVAVTSWKKPHKQKKKKKKTVILAGIIKHYPAEKCQQIVLTGKS